MKVLGISNDYYNSNVYKSIHNALICQGIDSTFFVPERLNTKSGLEPKIFEAPCYSKWDRLLYKNKQRKIYRELQNTIAQVQPNIIHAYFLFSAGYIALLAKQEYGIPYVVTVQNTDINFFLKYAIHLRSLGIRILQNAEKVLFISNTYRESLTDRYLPLTEKEDILIKTRIIPFCIDDYWLNTTTKTRERPSRELNIICAGSIDKNKNQAATVAACELLVKNGYDVHYTIVGRIRNKQYFMTLEKSKVVSYNSFMTKEQLSETYQEQDIFIMPSFSESFGLVYAEAMSQGLPILYSQGQGFDQQFPEGTVGYHVDANNPKDIEEKIIKILDDYDRISTNCIALSKKFDSKLISKELIEIYEQIL